MASESFRRKLTSILSADVQDYSRLMGADEVGTLQRLNESRTIIDRTIAAHRGRVVNTAGDSVLAEFESPVEAVQCAAEMQDEIAARNSALADDQKMRWRVGINLGDVMIDGDNIFGDGVNIAARLQALAEAGGICISGAAYDLVEARLPYTYVALGEQRVKNIARPVRAYRVVAGEKSIPAAEPRSPRRRRWFRPGRAVGGISVVALVWAILAGPPATTDPGMTPAVAVLPFRAIGDAAAEVEFSEGLTEDVIVALSAQTELRVVLSDEPGSPQEVGARLHVAYVAGTRYHYRRRDRWRREPARRRHRHPGFGPHRRPPMAVTPPPMLPSVRTLPPAARTSPAITSPTEISPPMTTTSSSTLARRFTSPPMRMTSPATSARTVIEPP